MPAKPVEIVDGDLVLRPYRATDVPAVQAAFADPDIVRWNPGPVGGSQTPSLIRAWIDRRNDWTTGTHASWGIFRADLLLGSVSVHSVDLLQETAEIGYWTVPAARGRGVATRAVLAATRFAFEVIGVYRMELVHAVDNDGSCRVAAKAGYAFEGLLRQAFRYGDGRRYDEHLHARLRDDLPGGLTGRGDGRRPTAFS